MLAVVLWGLSFVATRVALDAFHPVGLISARLGLATLLLGALVVLRGGERLPGRADLPLCTLLGAILAAHYVIQTTGLRFTSAVNAGWIVGFQPAVIALGSRLFLGERLQRLGWIGVLVGALGVLLVTVTAPPDFANARAGDALQLVACGTWTAYVLTAAGVLRRNDALVVTTFAMAVAAVATAAASSWTGWFAGEPTVRALGAAAFLGVFCSAVALWLWSRALSSHGAAKTAAALYLEPFTTLAAAVPLLAEPLVLEALIGGPIVLLGVWLVGRSRAGSP